MREGLIPLFVILSAAFLPNAWAEPQLTARVSSTQPVLDESLLVTLDIEWAQAEGSYAFTLPMLPLKNLILKRQGESQETFQKGDALAARKTFVFEVQPEKKGNARIESFALTYVESTSGSSGELKVPAFDIQVRAKGLPVIVKTLAAGALAVVAALSVILMVLRGKRKRLNSARGPVELSLEDRAAGALRQLPAVSSESEALSKGGVVFRSYLLEKFALAQSSAGDAEIVRTLEDKSFDVSEVRAARRLLEKFREARYSGVPLASSEVQSILEESASWIERRRILGASAQSVKK